jgi:small-conductance mechanosensitive channel
MLLKPLDFGRIAQALTWPAGWAEIGLTVLSILLAWLLDRRMARHRATTPGPDRLDSIASIVFPLLALLFLYVCSVLYRRWYGEPFLITVAIALMAALLVIRALVYGLRRLVPHQEAAVRPYERAVGAVVWIGLALYYVGVLPPIVNALDRIQVPIGKVHPTVMSLLSGLGVVVGALIFALWISSLLESRLDRMTRIDSNLRAVVIRVVRAVLLVLAGLTALQAVGFDLTLLTIFSGAIGVGVGLGLQKLASNYIAGFTILLDRSIKLGDTITVEGKWTGSVTAVTGRYVLIRGGDGVEVIVPNETLITTTVLNHSHSHAAPQIRIAVQLSVASDVDVDRALALLCEAALAEPRVMRDAPFAPRGFVAGFGDSGVNLELGVFVHDPLVDQFDVKSSLHRAILRTFGAHGIEVSYPHRAVRLTGDRRGQDHDEASASPAGGPAAPAPAPAGG